MSRQQLILALLLFVLHALLFFLLPLFQPIDLKDHLLNIQQFIAKAEFPFHFLYYFSVALLAGFSQNFTTLQIAAAFLLTVLVLAKWYISIWIAQKEIGKQNHLLFFTGLLFAFSFPVAYNHWYLGQFPPNLWHNSTTIALMPFAILLFYLSFQYLNHSEKSNRNLFTILSLIVLHIFIKPNFLLPFVGAFAAELVLYQRNRLFQWRSLIILIFSTLAICTAYFFIVETEQTAVSLAPFQTWAYYSNNFIISLLASFAFPLLFFVVFQVRIFSSPLLRYAMFTLTLSFLPFIIFHEGHGNLAWQIYVANYILYLCCGIEYLKRLRTIGIPNLPFGISVSTFKAHLKFALPFLILLLQEITGVLYLVRMFLRSAFE